MTLINQQSHKPQNLTNNNLSNAGETRDKAITFQTSRNQGQINEITKNAPRN